MATTIAIAAFASAFTSRSVTACSCKRQEDKWKTSILFFTVFHAESLEVLFEAFMGPHVGTGCLVATSLQKELAILRAR